MSENKLVQLLNQYKHEHTIMETGKVLQIKPITTGQMKSVLQYEGNEDVGVVEMVLDDIITGCVVTESFNIDELTLQDRFELLIAIRRVSKGDNYTFTIRCPKCKTESIQSIDLSELKVVPFKNPEMTDIKINDALTISLGYVRRGHQKESDVLVSKMGKMSETQIRSEIATYMYAFGMTGFKSGQDVISDVSIEDRKNFLDALSASDYDMINGWYEDHNYGTEFKYTVKCKGGVNCDFEQEEDIPVTGFFF